MESNGEQNKTNFFKQNILSNHKSVLLSHGISSSDKDIDIPLLYWIPKLRKALINNTLLQDLVTLVKPLSKLLTIIFSKIKEDIKRNTATIYSRNGVHQM